MFNYLIYLQNKRYFVIQKITHQILYKSLFLIDMQKATKTILSATGILVFVLMSFSLQQTSGTVKLVNHQKKTVPFKTNKAKIEWVNGFVNIALLSTDGQIIQINQIPEGLLKNTTLRSSKINLLLISGDKPYKPLSTHRPLFEITCKKATAGQPISISAQGKLYNNKAWYLVDVKVSGVLPTQQFKSTQKNSN